MKVVLPAANSLTVPATRGHMGETEFFTANFPMAMVVKLFLYEPAAMGSLSAECRNQRALKKARIPEIADYIVNNEDYIFSSITVSVHRPALTFHPSELDPSVGLLELPMEEEWIVNDGQHRVAGIAEALQRSPHRRTDTLSVVILPGTNLERCQQVFADLNRTVQKSSKSLNILFDQREPLSVITNACVERVRLFKGRIDKQHVSLALRSAAFATLSGIQAANKQLLGELTTTKIEGTRLRQLEDLAVDFWEHVTNVVEPWPDIASGRLKASDARAYYLSSYALALWAIGSVGHCAIAAGGDWKTCLDPLKDVDWRKTNPEWQGVAMQGGEVITRTTTRKAAADQLRWKAGLGSRPHPVV